MNNAGRWAIVLSLSLVLVSCVPPVHRMSRDESFMKQDAGRKAWRKVAVLPFAGDTAFRRTAAEWLAFRVGKHGLFEIVVPSLAEIELKKQGTLIGEAGATVEEAQRAGQMLGVDGVVFGSVDPSARGGREPAGVEARVVDVATGKVVADSLRSPLARVRYAQRGVMAAVDLIAEDLAPVLYAVAGKAWTPPPKNETDGPAPPGHEAPVTGR